jgi:prepilin-type processing-associated H-X9-DG protein
MRWACGHRFPDWLGGPMALRRGAFTLVELLVVLGTISLLMSLLIPAIQRVRAAADRMICGSNLYQLGIALQHYHADYNRFPMGYTSNRAIEQFPRMTWLARLLPFIEQDGLWEITVAAYQQDRIAFDNPPHIGFSTPMKLFSCPSDERMSSAQPTLRGRIAALTSYVGVLGTDYRVTDGVLYRDSRTRITDIHDGSSNTIMVGERPPSADNFYGWWYAGFGQNATGSLDMLLGGSEINFGAGTVGGCPPGPYSFGPGSPSNLCDVFHFWSMHQTGANFLFGDGSVRYLGYHVPPELIPALSTRGGAETVSVE